MAVNHIFFQQGTNHGSALRSGLNQIENGIERLNDLLGTMALMIDGDGTNAAHFVYMTEKFGFETTAGAKAAWEELNSAMAKLNTDGSVSNVNAALTQLFNKLR